MNGVAPMTNCASLPTFDEDGSLLAVVETARGSTTKIKFEPRLQSFLFDPPFVLGLRYPYDSGFFASTLAPDGAGIRLHPAIRLSLRRSQPSAIDRST